VTSDSPLDGPEFYAAAARADRSGGTSWADALDRFHEVKTVEDPVNGALSDAEAEFYVATLGAAGADGGERGEPGLVCDARRGP